MTKAMDSGLDMSKESKSEQGQDGVWMRPCTTVVNDSSETYRQPERVVAQEIKVQEVQEGLARQDKENQKLDPVQVCQKSSRVKEDRKTIL